MIADAIGLRRPLYEHVPFGYIRPMDNEFCFDRRIIGNLGLNIFDYLTNKEVVQLLTLPNHERTSVHNRNNWIYDLNEHPIEPPSPPETPPIYEYLDDPIPVDESDPETPPNYYNIDEPELPSYAENLTKILTRLDGFHTDITNVKDEIKSML